MTTTSKIITFLFFINLLIFGYNSQEEKNQSNSANFLTSLNETNANTTSIVIGSKADQGSQDIGIDIRPIDLDFPRLHFPPICPDCNYKTVLCPKVSLHNYFCVNFYYPVCGYYSKCNSEGIRHQEFKNGCYACLDDDVLYYETRPCSPQIYPITSYEFTFCKPSDKFVENCQSCNNPVCGYYKKLNNVLRDFYEEFSNGCTACQHEGIIKYAQGPCPLSPAY